MGKSSVGRDQQEFEGKTYYWTACIHDFCGNNSHSGFWADTWEDDQGNLAVSCGGDWISYFPKFKEKQEEWDKAHRDDWDLDEAVEFTKKLWESFNYPNLFLGEEASELALKIGDATYLGEAIKWVEDHSTFEDKTVNELASKN